MHLLRDLLRYAPAGLAFVPYQKADAAVDRKRATVFTVALKTMLMR